MQMGSPGVSVVTVKPSSDGVYRGDDTLAVDNAVYMGGKDQAGVGSQYSHVGIFNPAASNKGLLIDGVWFISNATSIIMFRYITSLLGTDDGIWTERNISGGNGLSHITSETNVALLGTERAQFSVAIADRMVMEFKVPWLLLANEGLVVVPGTVNASMSAYFFGREI